MKVEDAGWIPAAACCVVLAIAVLTFLLMTSARIPRAQDFMRSLRTRFRRVIRSFKVPTAR